MALPNLSDIPKTVGKVMTQLGSLEKKVEKFAKNGGKAAVDAAVKPVIGTLATLKKWVVGQIGELWKTVKGLGQRVVELGNRVAALEKRLNPLTPLATQAALIATHEPRLKKIEGMDRITDTKLERAAGKTAKLEAEVRELKETVKMLKKHVQDIERK